MTILQTALEAIETLLTDNASEASQAAAADARIKLANAMAVEPVAWTRTNDHGGGVLSHSLHSERPKNPPFPALAWITPLYLHPPQQVAVPSGERADLIARLDEASSPGWTHEEIDELCGKAADMLEADVSLIGEDNKAQQDKQDWSRFHHLMKKHGLHPGRTDDDLLEILDATLSEQAQQAKQVPMTTDDLYAAYIAAADQMLRAQDERLAFAFARAIEAHHGITPK